MPSNKKVVLVLDEAAAKSLLRADHVNDDSQGWGEDNDRALDAVRTALQEDQRVEALSDEAVELRRDLILALPDGWTSTRNLASAVGVGQFQSIDAVRCTLYRLRGEGLAELRRRGGSGGYLWRRSGTDLDDQEGAG